jgi:hypothetical protein
MSHSSRVRQTAEIAARREWLPVSMDSGGEATSYALNMVRNGSPNGVPNSVYVQDDRRWLARETTSRSAR